MRIIKSIGIILLILFVLFFACVLVAFKTGILTDYARDYAVSEIQRVTGKNIRIGKIEIGFIDNITIRDIEIPVGRTIGPEGDFLSIKSIAIRYNLIDYFFRKTQIDKSLSSIIIHSPTFFLKKENNEFNLSKFLSTLNLDNGQAQGQHGGPPLPINRLFIDNGKIIYEDKDRKFFGTLNDIKGSILLKDIKQVPQSIFINLRCSTGKDKHENLDFFYVHSFAKNNYKTSITIDRADMLQWFDYLVPGNNYTVQKGVFSAGMSDEGDGFTPSQEHLAGNLKIENCGIKFTNGMEISDINSAVFLKEGKIQTKSTSFSAFGGSADIKGEASDVFKKMQYNITLAFKSIDSGKINPDNFKGGVNGSLNITGDKDNPLIAGSIDWDDGELHGIPVKNLAADFDYKAGVINISKIKGMLADGQTEGSGKVILKKNAGKSLITVNVTGSKIKQVFNRSDFKGMMNASLKISGKLDSLKIKANISSNEAGFSGINTKNLKGELNIDGDKITGLLTFDSNKYKGLELAAGVKLEKNGFTISNLSLFNRETKLMSAAGNYSSASKKINVDVSFEKIILSNFDMDYLKDRQLDATLSGGILLRGTSDAPIVDFTLNKIPVIVRGVRYKLDAQGEYADNAITLTNLDFGGQLSANGSFSFKTKLFNAETRFSGFKGDIISELTKLRQFDNSVINGNASIKKQAGGYAGEVKLSAVYQKGLYKEASLDIKGENGQFSINKIYIKQTGGLLKASGSYAVKNDDSMSLTLQGLMQDYKINDKLTAKSNFSISTYFSGENNTRAGAFKADFTGVYLNGKQMDDLNMDFKTENNEVPSFSVLWGEEYSATGRITGGENPKINMIATVNNADLYPIYTIFNLRDKPLGKDSLIKGQVKIDGGLDNASFNCVLSQQEGTVKGSGDVGIKKEGIFYKLSRINVKYEAENLSLENFGVIFDQNFDGTGKLTASGSLNGQADNVSGHGELIMTSGRIFDTPYDSIEVQYGSENKKITLEKGVLNYKSSYINLSGSSLELKDKGDYYTTLKADMKDFVFQSNKLNGLLNFYGRIANDKKLLIDGSLESDNFIFKNYNFKPFMLKINYSDDELLLESKKGKGDMKADIKVEKDALLFKEFYIKDRFGFEIAKIKGKLNKSKGDSDMAMEVGNMDPQTVNDLLGWDHTWKGTLSGMIKVSGNMQKPSFTIDVKVSNGTVDNVDFDVFSGLITLKNDWVNLSPVQNMILSKAGKYDVSISGKIPAPISKEGIEKLKGAQMDVQAELKGGDLSVLKFLPWVDDASGLTEADLNIKGTTEFPEASGKVNVTDGDLKIKYLFGDVQHLYASILIKNNVIDIYTLKGETKKGTIQIKNLAEGNGGMLKGLHLDTVNWKVVNIGDKAVFSNTPEMEFLDGSADLDLSVSGPLDGPDIKGTMKFTNCRVTYPPKMSQQKTETGAEGGNFVKNINWDVAIYAGENVYFYNDTTEVSMKIKDKPLLLKGRGDMMDMNGDILIDRGTYKYVNTDFSIDTTKESKIMFDNTRLPMMDVYMTATLSGIDMRQTDMNGNDIKQPDGTVASKSTDITVNLHSYGRPGNITIDVTSVPSYDKNRIFYIMTFGRDMDSSNMVNQGDISRAVDMIGNFLVKQPVIANTVKKIVPVDVIGFKITGLTNFLSGNAGKTTAQNAATGTAKTGPTEVELDMGKYFMEKLYVGYNLILTDTPLLTGIQTQNGWTIEQSLSAEYSIDATKKFVISKTFAPGLSLNPLPDYFGIQSIVTFSDWGKDKSASRATPTPTK